MKTTAILIALAASNNKSVSEIRNEIRTALDEGWNNPDPTVREHWHKISKTDAKPSVEEVIRYISKQAKSKQSDITGIVCSKSK